MDCHGDPPGGHLPSLGVLRHRGLQSGMAAVAIVAFHDPLDNENMKYSYGREHFETLGMLMFLVSLAWAYSTSNDTWFRV